MRTFAQAEHRVENRRLQGGEMTPIKHQAQALPTQPLTPSRAAPRGLAQAALPPSDKGRSIVGRRRPSGMPVAFPCVKIGPLHPARRTSILKLAATLLIAGAAVAGAPEKPNFLILLADDISASHLGCYGALNPGTSPNIDRLAKKGGASITCL